MRHIGRYSSPGRSVVITLSSTIDCFSNTDKLTLPELWPNALSARRHQQGQRLRASGRLAEADEVDNMAVAIEKKAEDHWRKTVEVCMLQCLCVDEMMVQQPWFSTK